MEAALAGRGLTHRENSTGRLTDCAFELADTRIAEAARMLVLRALDLPIEPSAVWRAAFGVVGDAFPFDDRAEPAVGAVIRGFAGVLMHSMTG